MAILESEPAVVTARTTPSGLAAQPGFYLSDRGSLYLRADRTVAVAAVADGTMAGWFGEARLGANGSFEITKALRSTGDDEGLVGDTMALSGRIAGGRATATFGPFAGQTMDQFIHTGAETGNEGYYHSMLPGTRDGELALFIGPSNRAFLYLHDGYTLDRANLVYQDGERLFRSRGYLGLTYEAIVDQANGTAVITVTRSTSGGGSLFVARFTASRERAAGNNRLVNLSARATTGEGDSLLIAGLVVAGNQPRRLLVRGIGPELLRQGVPVALSDPILNIYRGGELADSVDDWGAARAELEPAFTRLGAFPLPAGGTDSALLRTFAPGVFTAHVSSARGPTSGTALVEVYDDGPADTTERLVNLSARGLVIPQDPLIGGFVIAGEGPRQVLLRAIGPSLAPLGVSNPLANPRLHVFKGSSLIASNDDWSTDMAAAAIILSHGERTGAFSLPMGSRDAALVLTLDPGLYTVHVNSADDSSGVALVEIYEIP